MSSTRKNMVYVDSNVFVYSVLSKSEKLSMLTKNILLQIAEGKVSAVTSVLTWDEFVWVARKTLGLGLAAIEGSKFLNLPNLKFIPADEFIIREAQRILELYKLKPRDAIHAATAVSSGIREIVTDDPDFDAIKEVKRIPIEKFR